MADVDFDEFDGGYAEHGMGAGAATGRARAMINLAGAACSVALVIGLGIWGYKLAVRDVSGIPVVRALEGPLRIAPENPGGDVAMHQGLSVNAVAAAGTALPLPEKLILAPKEVALTAEDQAGTAELAQLPTADSLASETEGIEAAPQPQASLTPVEIAPSALPEADPVGAAQDATSLAVTAPLPATQEDAVAAALAAALADGDGAEGGVSAVETAAADPVKSTRPRSRPTNHNVAPVAAEPAAVVAEAAPQAAAEAASTVAAAAQEIDPSTIPAGTRLVQLGAFDDEASARAEWARLQTAFPDLLPGKAMVVQAAQSGGRTFYRLRAHGFANEDVARQFCATMLAQNASCIPVAQK